MCAKNFPPLFSQEFSGAEGGGGEISTTLDRDTQIPYGIKFRQLYLGPVR